MRQRAHLWMPPTSSASAGLRTSVARSPPAKPFTQLYYWDLSVLPVLSNCGLRLSLDMHLKLRAAQNAPQVRPGRGASPRGAALSGAAPCAVAMSWMPRCEMERAASASASLPISSMTCAQAAGRQHT